jgi:large subunit ribosomal protein L11
MKIKLLVEGGNMKPGPAIAQKIGPLGINMGKVIQDVNSATQNFKGLKVPVEIDVDTKTKDFEIEVGSPPVSELIKKELGIDKASGEQKKQSAGNLAIEQAIKVAKTKHNHMLDKDLKSAVKSVVGSCVSLGVLVESKEAKEVEEEIDEGKYDKEISEGKTEVDKKKQKKLEKEFKEIRNKQKEIIKKEEEEKKAEEEEAEEEEGEEEQEAEGEEEEEK